MDSFIEDVVATIDAVAARRRSKKARRIDISFDEWNVWYQSRFPGSAAIDIDVAGPRIEDRYSALDAVVVGDLLSSLINHSDRVKIACLAQLVNVIAPIMTEPAGAIWRQPTFHPFAAVATDARGRSLVTRIDAPELATRRYGDVPAVAASATHDPTTGDVAVFLTNRADHPVTVDLRHPGFNGWTTVSARHIAADDRGPRDRATSAEIGLTPLEVSGSEYGHRTTLILAPHSWTAVRAATAATD
jgi:alpha-N-arabinofuranosidase